jgi:hypothetical protein
MFCLIIAAKKQQENWLIFMANIQSPPGLLNIFEVLNRVGIGPASLEVSVEVDKTRSDYEDGNYGTIHTLIDAHDINVLERFLKEKRYPIKINLAYIRFSIHPSKQLQPLQAGICVKEYLDDDSLLKDTLTFITMHRCRALLSGNHLKAYVLNNYVYHELPSKYWDYDENWYRLLIDGCAQGKVPTIGDFFGSVYFKKKDVNHCISSKLCLPSNFDEEPSTFNGSQSLINLNLYTTPWLQVLSAIYEEYGQEKLAQVSKISIEYFINDYIKKHKLDISSSDIPFLAKFIRLAEQKDGRKYHAKQKLQKLKKQ